MNNYHYNVVALGVTNSGKSATLSSLADTPSLFRSGDVPRLTRSIDEMTVGPVCYVDTPGLDADLADDRLAAEMMGKADAILWCHSLRNGELRQREIDALRLLAAQRHAIYRTCFVLTHADDLALAESESQEQINMVSREIARQLKEIFGLYYVGTGENWPTLEEVSARKPHPFNVVANNRYWLGRRLHCNRDSVMFRSGIPKLRTHLHKMANLRKVNVQARRSLSPL